MMPGLLTSSRTRAKLLMKKLHRPTDGNLKSFTDNNNIYSKMGRQMKLNYYKSVIEENKYDMKKTWSVLKWNDGVLGLFCAHCLG